MASMSPTIRDYHAHVYFDAVEAEAARALCERLRDAFSLAMGRLHSGPLGPHPRGSCQLTVSRSSIGPVLEWLLEHRGAFTVFIHANTGDDWLDHTRHAIWLGESETLALDVFAADAAQGDAQP